MIHQKEYISSLWHYKGSTSKLLWNYVFLTFFSSLFRLFFTDMELQDSTDILFSTDKVM